MKTLANIAVGLCIQHKITGKVVAVSRGIGSNNWDLPCGKLEETDNSLFAGACREVWEETGWFWTEDVLTNTNPFVDLCPAQDPGDIDFISVFHYIKDGELNERYLRSSSEGDVALVDPHKVLTGRFKEYNKRLMSFFKVLEFFAEKAKEI